MTITQYGCTIQEDNLKGRQTHRKTTSQEVDPTGQHYIRKTPHRKITSQEDCLSGRQPQRKMTQQKDNPKEDKLKE